MSNPSRWPLRVGLVGYGFAGRIFHAPLVHATPGLELAAICSSRRADVLADWPHLDVVATPEALFARPGLDMVVIATPNRTHAPLAIAALRAGLHVVVDKPFTLNVAQARAAATVAKAHDRVLSVFQNRRWDSDFLGIRQHVRAGTIGRVTELEARMDRFRPQVRARWREMDAPGSGLWFDLGPHMADQALQLFGLPDTVQASLARQRDHASGTDWAQVMLTYGSLRVSLHCSLLAAWAGPRFVVHGTHGSLLKHHADQQENQLRAGLQPGAPGWGLDQDDIMLFDGSDTTRHLPVPPGDYRIYYALLRDAILGRGPNPVPPIQAIALMAVLETAMAASTAGRALALPLTGAECQQWTQVWEK
ncbi:oxidoreductase [Komagataeibacter rhaeticus]|uniref:Oxidoreductase n=1 Tax=Komagataeibacter rhaeticus TaxID=215221 RepID=A0A181CE84_9PROT|nr:oxidoreductase [Komagataeibacter rhaeticus]ATU74036.1 oxidoreductase [Komagataeibacter xylinus]EGG77905.1 Putative oxidoreductase ydgJ [Gluconacetobacter sp. SXCC-1]KDU97587.1 oxidoreductase [Komagataeibacter rhaeticus AF1]MBL7240873.1 oxidoreductase [Komagataeibacter rhaeticus]PYD54885.1 oxidoreductase [Komagataeibacter rhaeticus]